jgi:hypothetical protein
LVTFTALYAAMLPCRVTLGTLTLANGSTTYAGITGGLTLTAGTET